MNTLKWIAACLTFAAAPAFAITLSTSPASKTTLDTVILEVQGDHPCAFIIPDSVRMDGGNFINVSYDTGANVFCIQAVPQPQRIVLGRFPAGTYTVQLVVPAGGIGVGSASFTVNTIPVSGDRGPMDDYSGHYVSDGTYEGVFVTQFGRMAFISYLSYAADGKPEWHVISDARWDPATNSFAGGLMRVESGIPTGTGTGTGTLTTFQYVGTARFTPTGQFDHARFEGNIFNRLVNRALTRYRF